MPRPQGIKNPGRGARFKFANTDKSLRLAGGFCLCLRCVFLRRVVLYTRMDNSLVQFYYSASFKKHMNDL